MNRRLSVAMSVVLILAGLLVLACNLVALVFGLRIWRLWPLIVVILGLFFVLPPLFVRGKRGVGGLFIPGVPILATGGILLFASVFRQWDVWSWLWPQEVLAVALGFLFAAIYMRLAWLVIPAIIVGLNGLVLQFCALTGLWSVWTVLWTVEPLAVGLSLLVVGAVKRSGPLFLAGITVCGLAGAALFGTVIILSGGWWVASLLGAIILTLLGLMVLIHGLGRRASFPTPVVEGETA